MMSSGQPSRKSLKAGVVGAGRRFISLLRILDSEQMAWLNVEVIAVADSNPLARGLNQARKRGIKTLTNYKSLFKQEEIQIIIELTGNQRLLNKLHREVPQGMKLIDHTSTLILQDVISSGREIKRQEEEIKLAKSFAETLSEDSDQAFFVLDPEYRILRANSKACRIAGISRQEAEGKFCFQVSHKAVAPCEGRETSCPMVQTLKTKKAAQTIHRHRDVNGENYYCKISTHPLFDSDGQIAQILEIYSEVDSDSQLDRMAVRYKSSLPDLIMEDKLISLGKLVASVAHEINNPLAGIYNFTKLILTSITEKNPSDEELDQFKKYLKLTVSEVERCSQIVSSLLSFARKKSLEAKEFDLVEMMDSLIVLTRHRMELSGIELITEILDSSIMVYADYTQIQQCLTNLIFNAMEAMENGGKLTIKAGYMVDKRAFIEIIDTGTGIEPEYLNQIFQPFFSTKTEGGGVGLGLSMVKGIIEDHGGRISVESEPDKGAKFTVILPSVTNKRLQVIPRDKNGE